MNNRISGGIFSSPFVNKLSAHLNDAIKIICKRNGINGLKVILTDDDTAFTNGTNIFIGKDLSLFHAADLTEKQQIGVVKGVLFHEIGHVLYSPFSTMLAANYHISAGTFWPTRPTVPSSVEDYMKRGDRERARVYTSYSTLCNIVEDGRIEALMAENNASYGALAAGLSLMRKVQFDRLSSLESTIQIYESANVDEKEEMALNIMFDMILQVAKFKTIKGFDNEEHTKHPFVKKLLGLIDDIDGAVESISAETFYTHINNIYSSLFDEYILPFLDKIKDEDEDIEDEKKDNGKKTGNKTSSSVQKALEKFDKSGKTTSGKVMTKKEMQDLEEKTKQTKEKASKASRNKKNMIDASNESDEKKETKKNENEVQVVQNEPDSIWSGFGEQEICSSKEEDIINGLDLAAISSIKDNHEESKNSIENELEGSCHIDFGEIHKNLTWRIERPYLNLPKNELDMVYRSYEKYIEVGREAARVIRPFLIKESSHPWQKNQYFGSRFKASRVAKADLRYFDKRTSVAATPSLSIAILVDESGSMSGSKIRIAQATAIALYEMCISLDVPYCVLGHSERYLNEDVCIRNYCFFDECDEDTKYKLLSIEANGCNRDGAALRFTADLLNKQNTDKKLLIVISDGQPSAKGYSGSIAKHDMQTVIKEYERFGISFIAAAIDADKKSIEEIYEPKRFLNINNLEELPNQLVDIVRKSLLNS